MKQLLYIAVSLVVVFTLGVQAHSEGSRKPRVRLVTFRGNAAFTDARLERLMVMKPSRFLARSNYHPEVLLDDLDNLTAFYRQNGYLEAVISDTTISVDSVARAVDITIEIREGPLTIIEGVTVFGNEYFPDSVLRGDIPSAVGDPLKRGAIQDAVINMLSRYAEHGFLDASITPNPLVNVEAHRAAVDFVIKENAQARIENIVPLGLKKTQSHVVERELLFESGDTVKYSRLLESQKRLYLTGLFESAFVRPGGAFSGNPGAKDIHVEVKEKPSSEFSGSIGYGSVEKVRGRIELSTINLAGTARQTGVALEANFIRQALTASFTEPWTFGTRWRTDVNAYIEFEQEPGYDSRTAGSRLTLGRRFGSFTTLSLTYRFENTEIWNVEVTEAETGLDPRVRSLTLAIARDSRDNLFDPHSGTYLEWSNEMAGSFLHGTNTFARSVVVAKYFKPLGRRALAAAAIEIGWMDLLGASEEIPLSERFYSGGPTSLRGFGYQKVGPIDEDGTPRGGRFKVVWNVLEYRHSLYRIVGGAMFLDLGNVWPDIGAVVLSELRPTAGVGLRVNSPIGIMRLDWGFNLDRKGDEAASLVHLAMGQAF